MNEDLKNKLATLRAKYTDDDSTQYLDEIENTLTTLIEESKIAQHPVFQTIVKDAQKKLDEINALILNDEKLTDADRKSLFEVRKVWKFMITRFGMTPHDEAIKLLTATIDGRLAQ